MQRQQQGQQSGSPAKLDHSELKLDLEAEEQTQGALKTVESLENAQTAR